MSVEPCGHLFQCCDHLLPAKAGALVEALVLRAEPGLLHAHERAGFGRRQRPGDDGLEPVRCLFARSVPAIGQPFIRLDDEDSQSVTPFQPDIGSARKLNLWPTTGWKSFFISHSSIR